MSGLLKHIWQKVWLTGVVVISLTSVLVVSHSLQAEVAQSASPKIRGTVVRDRIISNDNTNAAGEIPNFDAVAPQDSTAAAFRNRINDNEWDHPTKPADSYFNDSVDLVLGDGGNDNHRDCHLKSTSKGSANAGVNYCAPYMKMHLLVPKNRDSVQVTLIDFCHNGWDHRTYSASSNGKKDANGKEIKGKIHKGSVFFVLGGKNDTFENFPTQARYDYKDFDEKKGVIARHSTFDPYFDMSGSVTKYGPEVTLAGGGKYKAVYHQREKQYKHCDHIAKKSKPEAGKKLPGEPMSRHNVEQTYTINLKNETPLDTIYLDGEQYNRYGIITSVAHIFDKEGDGGDNYNRSSPDIDKLITVGDATPETKGWLWVGHYANYYNQFDIKTESGSYLTFLGGDNTGGINLTGGFYMTQPFGAYARCVGGSCTKGSNSSLSNLPSIHCWNQAPDSQKNKSNCVDDSHWGTYLDFTIPESHKDDSAGVTKDISFTVFDVDSHDDVYINLYERDIGSSADWTKLTNFCKKKPNGACSLPGGQRDVTEKPWTPDTSSNQGNKKHYNIKTINNGTFEIKKNESCSTVSTTVDSDTNNCKFKIILHDSDYLKQDKAYRFVVYDVGIDDYIQVRLPFDQYSGGSSQPKVEVDISCAPSCKNVGNNRVAQGKFSVSQLDWGTPPPSLNKSDIEYQLILKEQSRTKSGGSWGTWATATDKATYRQKTTGEISGLISQLQESTATTQYRYQIKLTGYFQSSSDTTLQRFDNDASYYAPVKNKNSSYFMYEKTTSNNVTSISFFNVDSQNTKTVIKNCSCSTPSGSCEFKQENIDYSKVKTTTFMGNIKFPLASTLIPGATSTKVVSQLPTLPTIPGYYHEGRPSSLPTTYTDDNTRYIWQSSTPSWVGYNPGTKMSSVYTGTPFYKQLTASSSPNIPDGSVDSNGFKYIFADKNRDTGYNIVDPPNTPTSSNYKVGKNKIEFHSPYKEASSQGPWKNKYEFFHKMDGAYKEGNNTGTSSDSYPSNGVMLADNDRITIENVGDIKFNSYKPASQQIGYTSWTTDWKLDIAHKFEYTINYKKYVPQFASATPIKWRHTYLPVEYDTNDPLNPFWVPDNDPNRTDNIRETSSSSPPDRLPSNPSAGDKGWEWSSTIGIQWNLTAKWPSSVTADSNTLTEEQKSEIKGTIHNCTFTLIAQMSQCLMTPRAKLDWGQDTMSPSRDMKKERTGPSSWSSSWYEIFELGDNQYYSNLEIHNPNDFAVQPIGGTKGTNGLNSVDKVKATNNPLKSYIKAGSLANSIPKKWTTDSKPYNFTPEAISVTESLDPNSLPDVPSKGTKEYREKNTTTKEWPGQYHLNWKGSWSSKANNNLLINNYVEIYITDSTKNSGQRTKVVDSWYWAGYEALYVFNQDGDCKTKASGDYSKYNPNNADPLLAPAAKDHLDVYLSGLPLKCKLSGGIFDLNDPDPKLEITLTNPNKVSVRIRENDWWAESDAQRAKDPQNYLPYEGSNALAKPPNVPLDPQGNPPPSNVIISNYSVIEPGGSKTIKIPSASWDPGHYRLAWLISAERGIEEWKNQPAFGSSTWPSNASRRKIDPSQGANWWANWWASSDNYPNKWWIDANLESIDDINLKRLHPNCTQTGETVTKVVYTPIVKTFLGGIANGGRFSTGGSVESSCDNNPALPTRLTNSQGTYGYSGFVKTNPALDSINGSGTASLLISQGLAYGLFSDQMGGNQGLNPSTALANLTLANTDYDVGNSKFGGDFRTDWRCIPNRWHPPTSLLDSTSTTINPDSSTNTWLNNKQYYYKPLKGNKSRGTLVLENGAAGSDSNLGKIKATVYVQGDLLIKTNLINDDLKKDHDLQNFGHLTIVVSGGNINIDPSVTRIDAILVAQPSLGSSNNLIAGQINLCYHSDNPTEIEHWSKCGHDAVSPIRINGALIAQNVLFNRVKNSFSQETSLTNQDNSLAAEIISLSPTYYTSVPIIPYSSNWENFTDAIFVLPPTI